MSGSVSGIDTSNYSVIAQLSADAAAIRQKLDTLTEQSASGLVSQTYAGLGSSASVSLDLNPEISQMSTWQSNINAVSGTMQVTQTAVSEISSIATNFASQPNTLNSTDPTAIDTLAASARRRSSRSRPARYRPTAATMSSPGRTAPTRRCPIDDILSSGFYTAINSAVAALGTNGSATTEASIIATGPPTPPAPRPSRPRCPSRRQHCRRAALRAGGQQPARHRRHPRQRQHLCRLHRQSTTGSYIRDILRGAGDDRLARSCQIDDYRIRDLVTDTDTSLQAPSPR